jgi:hypothetical protein
VEEATEKETGRRCSGSERCSSICDATARGVNEEGRRRCGERQFLGRLLLGREGKGRGCTKRWGRGRLPAAINGGGAQWGGRERRGKAVAGGEGVRRCVGALAHLRRVVEEREEREREGRRGEEWRCVDHGGSSRLEVGEDADEWTPSVSG